MPRNGDKSGSAGVSCGQHGCQRTAKFIVPWPGSRPMPMCATHTSQSESIALAMGIAVFPMPLVGVDGGEGTRHG